jgi:hypothetical protein
MPTMTCLAATIAFLCSTVAAAQFHTADDNARIGIIGPDGQMQLLPTAEEMAEAASRGTDISPFAAYAQRRLELASLVTEVVHVDDDAPVGGDGTSWHTAHQSLQDALTQDYSDRLVEIRMAQGTYRPDRFKGTNTHDPQATFTPRYEDTQTPTGIFRITGGYAGFGAPDPDRKDPQQFRTVITGDLLDDDGPDFTNYDDNSLVLFDGFNSELHGLVLEHARQAMVGDGSLTIDGCVVRFHSGIEFRGASVFSGADVIVVKRSIFHNNRSGYSGGAVSAFSANTALVSNRFLSNTGVTGGAVATGINSFGPIVMQNNYFAGNAAAGNTGSIGGAASIIMPPIFACNTVVFNRSEDGDFGGFGRYSYHLVNHYTTFDVYHMNEGRTGTGLHEQFPTLIRFADYTERDIAHHIRGSFVQDWESSESNQPNSFASSFDSIRDNSGDEVLFIDLAGPDGIIGTLDDDPTPRPDSPNIDRIVDLEGAEIALLDFADLNENGIVDEPLPYDLLGNPRSINTPGIGNPNGGIDAGAIEYAGDPNRFDYAQPISGRRISPLDGCQGDEPIRLYVDPSGPISGDGSSWQSPLLELTQALDIARARCGPVEIWLAAGTYLPDFSVPEWRASFRITSNTTILGGFAGWEELAEQRDPTENQTILSGDQFGNDDPDDPDSILDNAYRIIVASGSRGGGTIDGVTISGGVARATRYAGAMWTNGCSFEGPYSTGAAITVESGEVSVINCTVSACGATYGAACATTGTGKLYIRNLQVLDNQLPVGCVLRRSQVFADGIDSILASPTELELFEVTLAPTANTTPFGGRLGVNTRVKITRSDVDFASRGSDSPNTSSGSVFVRQFEAESSLLTQITEIRSTSTQISNCTIIGFQGVRFQPQRNPSRPRRLIVTNSIALPGLFAFEELSPISEAINCMYASSNFARRDQEIRIFSYQIDEIFMDISGPDSNVFTPDGDYRLAPGSPAINSGSNDLVGSDRDILGNDRIINGVVDRGAYETVNFCDGDVTGDGVVDLADLNLVLANYGQSGVPGDANGDGVVDMIDLNYVLAVFGKDCSPP